VPGPRVVSFVVVRNSAFQVAPALLLPIYCSQYVALLYTLGSHVVMTSVGSDGYLGSIVMAT
jgi:hypothetical protein